MRNNKIVFLGIDGAGKSTMVEHSRAYLKSQGYEAIIIPFHKWVFADKLRNVFGKALDKGRTGRNAPYSPKKNSLAALSKPFVALLDNILFYWLNRPGKKKEVYLYDRFICATQIKFIALNYRAKWLKFIWWNIHPPLIILFDIDVETSVKRQLSRNDPYAYKPEQLQIERDLYLKFAKSKNAFIFDNTKADIEASFNRIKEIIDTEIINKQK